MSLHLDDHLELCAAQSLGALDTAGRRRLIAHLDEGCERCEGALERMHSGVARMSAALAAAPLAPALRSMAIADAAATSGVAALPKEGNVYLHGEGGSPRALFTWQGWLFVYLAALMTLLAVLSWSDARRARSETAAVREMLTRLSQEFVDASSGDQAFTAPGSRVMLLTPVAPGAVHGRAAIDPGGRHAVVAVEGLTVPPGQSAVVWLLPESTTPARDGTGARWLGVLHSAATGSLVLHATNVGAARGVVVSVEPTDTTPRAPTHVVVAGTATP